MTYKYSTLPKSLRGLFLGSLSTLVILLGTISPALAELFSTDLSSGSDNFYASYDNVDDAFDQLTTSALQAALPSYIGDPSTATAVINYRGLDMNVAFNTANSTELTFTIPALNVSESFTGATRDESKELLVDYLQGEGADTVDRIQQALARVSPVDPVAGNPGSLMGKLVDSDFEMATSLSHFELASTPGGMDLLNRALGSAAEPLGRTLPGAETFDVDRTGAPSSGADEMGDTGSVLASDYAAANSTDSAVRDASTTTQSDGGERAGSGDKGRLAESTTDQEGQGEQATASQLETGFQSPGGVFGIDLSHQTLDLDGEKSNTETITVDYEYYFQDPLKVLRIKMPLAITDTEGAKSYHANAGIDFSYPLTRRWSLTPGVSYGVGGSEDLGGGASINGLSLTSTFRWIHGDYLYTLGNMVGRYQTGSVSLGDYEINPDVSNTVFRNGVVVHRPMLMFDLPTMAQVFVVDTRYTGDDLFTEHYYELGFALGVITDEALISEDTFNIGMSYLDSTDADIKGYKINFGYRF